MKVKRTEDGFLLVLDIGDEIVTSLKQLASNERIGFATITGIGAVHKAVLGYFDVDQKQYLKRQYGPESVELISLLGNLSRLDGEPFLTVMFCWEIEKCARSVGACSKLMFRSPSRYSCAFLKVKWRAASIPSAGSTPSRCEHTKSLISGEC